MRERILARPHRHGDCWPFTGRIGAGHVHRHDELEFNLVVRGRMTYVVANQRLDLRRHDLLWLHPDEDHLLIDHSADLLLWIAVLRQDRLRALCGPAAVAALTARRPTAGRVRRLAAADTRALDRLCLDLQDRRACDDVMATGVAHATVLAWQAFQGADAATSPATVDPAIDRVARALAAGDDRSVAALARLVGLHPDTLSRRFHRDLGVRLADYRNRCRIERFLDRMDTGRHTVLDAALAAGFGSYPQFHRVFRRVMGTSARAWRRAASGAGRSP